MAGAIRTGVVTREYEEGWERTFGATLYHEDSDDVEDAVGGAAEVPAALDTGPVVPGEESRAPQLGDGTVTYVCERCRRTLPSDKLCACSDRASGMTYSCGHCGRSVTGTGELCDVCQYHADERAARRAAVIATFRRARRG